MSVVNAGPPDTGCLYYRFLNKFLSICPKTKFLGGKIYFVHLLSPIMTKYLKKKKKIDHILRCNVRAELPIFPKREYLGKFKCYTYLLIAPYHVSQHITNINRVDHEI